MAAVYQLTFFLLKQSLLVFGDVLNRGGWFWHYLVNTNMLTVVSLFLNGHFPVGSGLADTGTSPFWILLELRVMDVLVTTGAIKHAKLHSE